MPARHPGRKRAIESRSTVWPTEARRAPDGAVSAPVKVMPADAKAAIEEFERRKREARDAKD